MHTIHADLAILKNVHLYAPEIKREIYKMPSEKKLESIDKYIAKQFARIEKKQEEMDAIEEQLLVRLIDEKDMIKNASKAVKVNINNRHPELANKIGVE